MEKTHSGWWIQSGPHVDEIREAETFNEKWELTNRYTALAWQAALRSRQGESNEDMVVAVKSMLNALYEIMPYLNETSRYQFLAPLAHKAIAQAEALSERTAPKPAKDGGER
jgi:hypothetical protein